MNYIRKSDDELLNNDTIIILNEIKIKLPHYQPYLFIFDIDGVVCDTNMHYLEEAKLSEIEYQKLMESRTVTPLFYQLYTMLQNNDMNFCFLTGRKEKSTYITKKMFSDANIHLTPNQIIYYPEELHWISDEYVKWKLFKIKELSINYSTVYYFDDNEILIQFLKQELQGYKNIYPFLIVGNGNGLEKKPQ